jgi:hypothetical protein
MASKRQLELMDQKQRLNAAIGEARARIDDAARGERFKDLALDAANLGKHAQAAAGVQAELNKILDAEEAARKG